MNFLSLRLVEIKGSDFLSKLSRRPVETPASTFWFLFSLLVFWFLSFTSIPKIKQILPANKCESRIIQRYLSQYRDKIFKTSKLTTKVTVWSFHDFNNYIFFVLSLLGARVPASNTEQETSHGNPRKEKKLTTSKELQLPQNDIWRYVWR